MTLPSPDPAAICVSSGFVDINTIAEVLLP